MKNAIIFFLCSIITIQCSNALENKKELTEYDKRRKRSFEIEEIIMQPAGIDKMNYVDYLAYFGPEWEDYKVKSDKAKEEFMKYFGEMKYRVIWNWDVDGDGNIEYLGVEEYPKVRRGIKKAILVDDTGSIKMYIDTKKGVYTKDHVGLNFKLLGIKDGDVECYSIGYIKREKGYGTGSFVGNSDLDYTKETVRASKNPSGWTMLGTFFLQRLDRDLKVMGNADYWNKNYSLKESYCDTDMVTIYWEYERDIILFDAMRGARSISEDLEDKRSKEEYYRKAKKKGRALDFPKILNSDDVEKAFQVKILR